MIFVRMRTLRRLAGAVATLVLFQGCAGVDVWPRPLTVPGEARPWPTPDAPGDMELDGVRESLLRLHNRARAERKRTRVEISPELQEAAQLHAEEMAGRGQMTHKGADGSSVADRVQNLGYRYRRCGENVAYGHYSPELVMRGWLTSPPHRKNILGDYRQVGLGYATAKDGTPYWCVTFGLPATR
ncbi:CAP domain-containing protein [Planctomyces sp. SH-PL62]|uniref:CAP domain-containing protein n=1 Tax=Planctomyces sp. SH-PL62 TaxID=1636152 RepID=UPI00078B577D|nr:CAP domain-containing protein [Planctomyces sp. SH-PL62]AMV39691.1 Cysteine-rich secretory protein family protein [Planctomyces sp. SH-PL62]